MVKKNKTRNDYRAELTQLIRETLDADGEEIYELGRFVEPKDVVGLLLARLVQLSRLPMETINLKTGQREPNTRVMNQIVKITKLLADTESRMHERGSDRPDAMVVTFQFPQDPGPDKPKLGQEVQRELDAGKVATRKAFAA